jgi:hypothetical protein
MTPNQRLERMRKSFDKNKTILADDYEYFTTPHESIPQSKVARKSAERNGRQSPKRNETQSSDRTGD